MTRNRATLSAAVVSLAAVTTSSVLACDYHWALGIAEPTVVFAPATPTTSSARSAGVAATNELLAADTVNDAAITSWMRNTTGKVGTSTDSTINNVVNKIPAD